MNTFKLICDIKIWKLKRTAFSRKAVMRIRLVFKQRIWIHGSVIFCGSGSTHVSDEMQCGFRSWIRNFFCTDPDPRGLKADAEADPDPYPNHWGKNDRIELILFKKILKILISNLLYQNWHDFNYLICIYRNILALNKLYLWNHLKLG